MASRFPYCAPGREARIDNQGISYVCSLFSLAKAHVNGFETKIFHQDKLDFNQDGVTTGLLTVAKDLDAEFPSFYSGMKITVQDSIAFKFWSTTFDVQEIDEIMFRNNRVNKSSENVIVTDRGRGPHTLYVKDFDSNMNIIYCINSQGLDEPYPKVHIDKVSQFYKVVCKATEALSRPKTSYEHSAAKHDTPGKDGSSSNQTSNRSLPIEKLMGNLTTSTNHAPSKEEQSGDGWISRFKKNFFKEMDGFLLP